MTSETETEKPKSSRKLIWIIPAVVLVAVAAILYSNRPASADEEQMIRAMTIIGGEQGSPVNDPRWHDEALKAIRSR